ncbi:MAG: MMPL family transporter [Acidilobaceae archaeon]|nr:MMPL family transporter [Acidilobaceae archaeon]MDW7974244.1 MMPL family transporter [Sulfolobales archaeon]
MRRYAFAALLAWTLFIFLLIPQALELDKRLQYSEEEFVPPGSEGYRGLELLRSLNYTAGDYMVVLFSPNDLATAKLVEERVLEAIGDREASVLGPYGAYEKIRERVRGELMEGVKAAVQRRAELVRLAKEAKAGYEEARSFLNLSYGLALAYLAVYQGALSAGHPAPADIAFATLEPQMTPQGRSLLYLFDLHFRNLSSSMEPERAAREAMIRTVGVFRPEAVRLLSSFTFSDFSNATRIAEYVYRVSGLEGLGLSFQSFALLLKDPENGATALVSESLGAVDSCLQEAFMSVLAGKEMGEAIGACEGLIDSKAPYPDILPSELKDRLISGERAAVYVLLKESVAIGEAAEIIKSVRKNLEGHTRELFFYGSLPFYVDLSERIINEIRKIDVATVVLVIILLAVLVGSISAPLVILMATTASLVASVGVLSIAALYFDVHYLARALMVPIVFGITVDYSVFYLFRVAEERGRGASWEEAIYLAWRRAGRALQLGGISVVLGFLAYAFTPTDAVRGIGIALSIASAVAFLSSYTLFPAVLYFLGERRTFWPSGTINVSGERQTRLLRRAAELSIRYRLPLLLLMIAFIVLGSIYLVEMGVSGNVYLSLTEDSTYVEGSRAAFSSFPPQIVTQVIIVAPKNVTLDSSLEKLFEQGLVKRAQIEERGDYLVVTAGVPLDPLDDRIFDSVSSIRQSLPEGALLTGFPAVRVDVVTNITREFFTYTLPLAVVLITAYLIVGMGSVLVPLRLLITVVFSSVFSMVVVAMVFHWMIGEEIYGTKVSSPIYWVIPITVLGIMITLGMDYDIFLTSRIREELEGGKREAGAIVSAVEKTGLVITVCGIILAGAFSSLLLAEIVIMQQAGLAVAVSILVDTFLVRPVLVPAIMSVFGKYNWWPGRGLIQKWD